MCDPERQQRENDERESAEGEKQIVREGGTIGRRGESGEAYLLFLASSLPPPLADAEGAGCSDDILWRTSTSWPLSLRHTRTASSLCGWREKGGGGRESVITKEIPLNFLPLTQITADFHHNTLSKPAL